MQPYAYGPPPSQRQEIPLIAEWGVQVTSARFLVGQQMYPIANITAVSPFSIPPKRAAAILWAVLCGLFAPFWFAGNAPGVGVLCIVMLAATVAWIVTRKATHGVMIATAGMQVRALVSQDLQHISRVVGAINQAISMR